MNTISHKNKLIFYFTFLTNFKPNNFNLFSSNKKFKFKKNNRIICRNFFLFILLLKYLNKNINSQSNIWVKPLKQKNLTILRAPYRYKLARQQITLSRYFIFYKILFNFNENFNFTSFKQINDFFNFFKKFNIWVESNIVYQFKIKCIFSFFLKNYFYV